MSSFGNAINNLKRRCLNAQARLVNFKFLGTRRQGICRTKKSQQYCKRKASGSLICYPHASGCMRINTWARKLSKDFSLRRHTLSRANQNAPSPSVKCVESLASEFLQQGRLRCAKASSLQISIRLTRLRATRNHVPNLSSWICYTWYHACVKGPNFTKQAGCKLQDFAQEVIVLNLRGILEEATLDKQQCVQHLA